MAVMISLQGSEPLFVYAAEKTEEEVREVPFERPEPVKSAEEALQEPEKENLETEVPKEESKEEQETEPEVPKEETQTEQENSQEENQEEIQAEQETTEETPVEIKEPQEYYPIQKETGELTAYDYASRTYRQEDGTYNTVIGGNQGTFVDDSGNLQETDNILRETDERSLTGEFTNGNNCYQVSLPSEITQDAGISVEKDGYYLEMVPSDGDYSHSVVKDNAILYNSVYDKVDIQYTVLDNSVKEDIVLNQPGTVTQFTYELRAPGMKAEQKENMVYLYPEGKSIEEAVFLLEAPSMEDAAGNISFHIDLRLEEKDGKIWMSVLPDTGWLEDETRQYPVRIDPTAVNIDKGNFILNGVQMGSPEIVIGDNNYPYVGYDDGYVSGNLPNFGVLHMVCRTYIKVNYDFAAIPKESIINNAVFSISQRTNFSHGASQFGLYRVEDAWQEEAVTWNNQPQNHVFEDQQNAKEHANEYIDYQVKDLVNGWIQGTYENHGMVLKAIDEATEKPAAMQCEVMNNRNSAYGPKMTINWKPAEPEDPFLKDVPLDDTTVLLRPMSEKDVKGKLMFDGVFPDGIAQSQSIVEYYLSPEEDAKDKHRVASAEKTYKYPDSTEYEKQFPNANKYKAKETNWQGALYTGLDYDKIYQFKASAIKDGNTGKEKTSDRFLIYKIKQFDTLPKVASYYGVPLTVLMKDNQVQDSLVMANNTIFVRNPKTQEPYNPDTLTDDDKWKIDGALIGRGLHCKFGFEPVNLNTGNFYLNQTDAELPELGGNFLIDRTYNSKGAEYNSLFGRGWSFGYDQYLTRMENGSILYKRGDGSFLLFQCDENGNYYAPEGYSYELHQAAYEGTEQDYIGWELSDEKKTVMSFDKNGLLRFVTDIRGNSTRLDYDENYSLKSITTPSGKIFAITQNENGYITEIVFPDGTKVSYEYDDKGNLTTVTDGGGIKKSYQYDKKHQMVSWKDGAGNTVIENTYDEEGRVVKQKDADGHTAQISYKKNQTITTDFEGNQTVYHYDGQYRTTSVEYPDGSSVAYTYNEQNQVATETNAKGTKSYTYDSAGNLLSETREDGAVESYTYNEQNLPLTVTDYNGAVTTYTYDGKGCMSSSTDAEGRVTAYGYDEAGRILSMTDPNGNTSTFTYEGAVLVSMTDPEGGMWSYAYDGMNRRISVTNPEGETEKILYDKSGRQIGEIAGDGGKTEYPLDAAGNIPKLTDPLGAVSTFTYDGQQRLLTSTDPEGHTTSCIYDKNGNKISKTDAKGNVTTYTYDSMGRLLSESAKETGTIEYTYDSAGRQVGMKDGRGAKTTYQYNVSGLVTSITDANGNKTSYTYDNMGNITAVQYPDGGQEIYTYDKTGKVITKTSVLGAVYTYHYDGNGNMISMSDDMERTWTYAYDKRNLLKEEKNPAGGITTYAYDKAGRMVSETNAQGQTTTYTYDKAGRVTSVTDAMGYIHKQKYDAGGNLIEETDGNGGIYQYTYDKIRNLRSITDPQGNITAMKYDALGNLKTTVDALKGTISYSNNTMGLPKKMTDAGEHVYVYTYDENGNNTTLTLPDGGVLSMEYNSLNQLVKSEDAAGLITKYEYDSMGRLSKASDNAGNDMSYVYDYDGNLISQTDVLGRTDSYTYDSYGRLLSVTEADGSTTTFGYDSMDNITEVTDAEGHKTSFSYDQAGNPLSMSKSEKAVYTYAYDKKNRITEEKNPLGAVKQFQYDGNDNVTQQTDENGTITSYRYDANNNLTGKTDGNGNQTTYGYDELNRKIKETTPQKETTEYRYDAIGNLIKQKDPLGQVTEFQYDAMGNMIKAISPKGAVLEYIYDKHSNLVKETDAKGNSTTYQVDLNGNVTEMTQANGGTYKYSYDAAGRLESMTSPLGYKKNFTYDKADNIIKESDSLKSSTSYTYDKLHHMLTVTDSLKGFTEYAYDELGNLTKETDPLGRSSQYQYDLAGRMVQVSDPLGNLTKFTYDPVGNITAMTKPGKRTTSYGYDKNYNLTSVTDPMGYVTETVFDKDNQVIEEKDALKQKVSYTYDKTGQITSVTDKRGFITKYTYDAHGNLLTATDRLGLKTKFSYDENDNLTQVIDAMGQGTAYEYDTMNNLTAFISSSGKTTKYTYDLEGNLKSIKDPAGREEGFGYDEKGRLSSHTYASGKKTVYDYDKLNHLLEKSYETAKGKQAEEPVQYAYNTAGERVSMQDETGKSRYEYDRLGRINKVIQGSKKAVTYEYDEAGNLKELQYPDGSRVQYAYDLNDNLINVTDKKGSNTAYHYDVLNRVTEVVRPNGIKTEIAYDEENHVTKLVNTCTKCKKQISAYEYSYNEEGYVIAENSSELEAGTRGTGKSCTHREKKITTSRTYEYDGNWELTRCTEKVKGGSTTVHNYTYDKVGNRTYYEKIIDGTQKEKYKYEYNDSNQLIKKKNCKIWGDRGILYTYDKDGNLIKSSGDAYEKPREYEYTAENRLAAVTEGSTVLMAALYDGDGNRIFQIDNTYQWEDCYGEEVLIPESQRTEKGDSPEEKLAEKIPKGPDAKGYTLTEYINDINTEYTEVLAEYGADDKLRQAYLYGNGRTGVEKEGKSSYYLYNGNGSVSGLISEKDVLGSSYRYDPYGVLVSGTPDAVNYYGYNGESTGAKTGLQYLRARYYQASTGTFTSEDSDLGSKREPLTRNRYAYVTNNPANYQDPSGHGKIWNAVKKVGKKIVNAARNLGKKAKKAVKSYLNMVNKAAAKSTNPQRSAARPAPAPVPNLPGKKRAQERKPYPDRNRNPLPAPGERNPVLGVNLGNGMYMPGQRPTHYYYQASYQEHAENVIREKVVHKVCIPGGTYVDYGSPEHKKAVIMTATALGTSLVLGYLGSTGILAKAGETASSKLMPVVDKAGAKLGSLIGESSELALAGGGSIKVPVSGNIKNMLLQMKVQNEVQKVVKETCEEIKNILGKENSYTNEYRTPSGGGGVTDNVKVGNKEVSFGHGGRHLAGTGLSIHDVNQAIANDVVIKNTGVNQFYKGQIEVNGIIIEYTSYGVKDGLINVGTYYPVQ